MRYQEKKRAEVKKRHWEKNTLCVLAVFFVVFLLTLGFFCSDGMIQAFWLPRFVAEVGLKDFRVEEVSFSFLFAPSLTMKKIRFVTPSGWRFSADLAEADWKNREFFFSRTRAIRKMRIVGASFQESDKMCVTGNKSEHRFSSCNMIVRQFFLTVKDGEKTLDHSNSLLWKKVCISSDDLSLHPLSGRLFFSGAVRSETGKHIFFESPSVSGSVRVSVKHGYPALQDLQMESRSMVLLPSGGLSPICSGELSGEIIGSEGVLQGRIRENGGSLLCWKMEMKQDTVCDFELHLTDSELSASLSKFIPGKITGVQGAANGTIRWNDGICSFRTHGKLYANLWNRLKSPQASFKMNGSFAFAKRLLKTEDSFVELALEKQNILALYLKKGTFSPDEVSFPEGELKLWNFPLDMGHGIPCLKETGCSGKICLSQKGKSKSFVLQMELQNKGNILASADGDTTFYPDSWNGAFRITLPNGTGLVETSGGIHSSGKFDGWSGVRNSRFSGACRMEGGIGGEQSRIELVSGPVSLDGLNGHCLKESCSFAGATFQMRHLHRYGENTATETGHIQLDNLFINPASEKFSFRVRYEGNLSSEILKVNFSGVSGEKNTPFAELTFSMNMAEEPKVMIASKLLELGTAEKLLSVFRSPTVSPESGEVLLPDMTFPFSPEEITRSTPVRLDLKGIRYSDGDPFSCQGLVRFCDGMKDLSELNISGNEIEKKAFLNLWRIL